MTVTVSPHPPRPIDSGRDRPDIRGRLRALIEEAWRRARRRRLIYGGVGLSIAVAGAIVFAILQGPANPPSGSPAVAGQNAQVAPSAQAPRFLAGGHIANAFFKLDGKRGRLLVHIRFPDSELRSWAIPRSSRIGGPFEWKPTGPYALMSGGGGHVEVGGHASTWYARLVGYVRTGNGARQHVVIKIKGRPEGTFVVIPTRPGALMRDTGFHTSWTLG